MGQRRQHGLQRGPGPQKPFQLQWHGRPGPKYMLDRHSTTHAPVSVNGRLFCIGNKEAVGSADGVMFGQDAYNGTMAWIAELPEFKSRVNIPRDCGYLAADENCVFLAAADKCLCLKADTAAPAALCAAQVLRFREVRVRMGLRGHRGGAALRQRCAKDSFYRNGRRPWYDRERAKVNSDFLFAVGQEDRRLKWRCRALVVAPTITVGGGRIYFSNSATSRSWNRGRGC